MKSSKRKVRKCKELPAKSWKTTFSLATTWREEENAEGCRYFEQESGASDQYLQNAACTNFAKEK